MKSLKKIQKNEIPMFKKPRIIKVSFYSKEAHVLKKEINENLRLGNIIYAEEEEK